MIYTIQVMTGMEKEYIKLFNNPDYELYFPTRTIKERHDGKLVTVEKPVFSGYVFVECKGVNFIKQDVYLFKNKGFIRFLFSNEYVTPLNQKDLELVSHFITKDSKKISKVSFDENNRIIVLDGILKGLEGRITKVDKRKQRVKIRLDLYNDSFDIDFAFEVIGNI